MNASWVVLAVLATGCGSVTALDDVGQPELEWRREHLTPLIDGPLIVNVSALGSYQRGVVEEAIDRINTASDVDAFVSTDTLLTHNIYATVMTNGMGCDVGTHAGYSVWKLPEAAGVCVKWDLDDDYRNLIVVTHELLHTLNVPHSTDPGSVMFTSVSSDVIDASIVEHIRQLAGLE